MVRFLPVNLRYTPPVGQIGYDLREAVITPISGNKS